MKRKIFIKSAVSLILALSMLTCMSACKKSVDTPSSSNLSPVQTHTTDKVAVNLMDGITAKTVSNKKADVKFIDSNMKLDVDLFKKSVEASKGIKPNVLVSPLSVQLAMAMTANGADNDTLNEMESVLGGGMSLSELNEYLHSYVEALPSYDNSKLSIADSIWFRDEEDRLMVNEEFLQTNADYYNAQAFKIPFDDAAASKINNWVDEHTDNMIDRIIDNVTPDSMLYLINAIAFDAKWKTSYLEEDVKERDFTALNGDVQKVDMMFSSEYTYLNDGSTQGFMRPYTDDHYSFAALLPNEDVDLYDYISSLTAEGLSETLNNAKDEKVNVCIPKFTYDYDLKMNSVLQDLGIKKAFDGAAADFSKLGNSSDGSLYIGNVLHKTFISVDEVGTKAAAVTAVEVVVNGIAIEDNTHTVYLNRPFVFMIIDNATKLPVFMGTLTEIPKQ